MPRDDLLFLCEGAQYHLAKMEEARWHTTAGERRDHKLFAWHLYAFYAILRTLWDVVLRDVNQRYALGLRLEDLTWGAVRSELNKRKRWDAFTDGLQTTTATTWFRNLIVKLYHPWYQELLSNHLPTTGAAPQTPFPHLEQIVTDCQGFFREITAAIATLYGTDLFPPPGSHRRQTPSPASRKPTRTSRA